MVCGAKPGKGAKRGNPDRKDVKTGLPSGNSLGKMCQGEKRNGRHRCMFFAKRYKNVKSGYSKWGRREGVDRGGVEGENFRETPTGKMGGMTRREDGLAGVEDVIRLPGYGKRKGKSFAEDPCEIGGKNRCVDVFVG